jgi:hypothetical protein
VGITISADDPRTIRAIEIAANADRWLKWRSADGHQAYGVPSQSNAGHHYVVTSSSCDCPDFRRDAVAAPDRPLDEANEPRACKHILAVRLFIELVRAQQQRPSRPIARPTQGHLSIVPRTDTGT